MPAGMHLPLVLRGIRQVRFLVHGQSIHIRPQSNDRIFSRSDHGDESRCKRQIAHADPCVREVCPQARRRLELLVGKFRMRMQPLKLCMRKVHNFCFRHWFPPDVETTGLLYKAKKFRTVAPSLFWICRSRRPFHRLRGSPSPLWRGRLNALTVRLPSSKAQPCPSSPTADRHPCGRSVRMPPSGDRSDGAGRAS